MELLFNNTKMESGIFQWKVKIDNLASWIAVGVSTHEVVSSKRFNAFIYHFEPHHSSLMSHNGRTWSLDLNENDGKNGFKFTKGSELELEMNCNTQQLTIRKVGSGEFVTFKQVELPVYPSIALHSPNDSVSFYNNVFLQK
ncbi:hypothetical protein C9374_004747 [Naegleria lovaniensis]|uniref:B30.2/SPRY domain-containing protein n=1 Tax=Naegleria lovaniensis TaxID=51637 RepID=A0AA88GM52_NAELO|nr:uncharacterized protein C9374_004747 [Naegleria lovaniensis]KAG2382780.1 hypothetical protein C9374_004747 [Naegleria lovaniensis]